MSDTRADVHAARTGDPTAYRRLVQRHAPAVCAAILPLMRDWAAAEEIAQEAFVSAWQRLDSLEHPERFGAWVRGIARHRAIDATRRAGHDREVAQHPLPEPTAPDLELEAQLDDARTEAALWEAVDALPVDQRDVMRAYYRDGHSVAEVATQFELAPATVRKRLSRARATLRRDVQQRLGARRVALAVVAAIAGAPQVARAGWGLGAAVGLAALAVVAMGLGGAVSSATARPPTPPTAVVVPTVLDDADSAAATSGIPSHVVHAFLAAEDARFYEHGGVDPWAVGRATWTTLSGGGIQGGSTITQQLARRLVDPDRAHPRLLRKAAETALAWELERRLTKDEILARYLSGVYLGDGTYGVDSAAEHYFDKPVHALTLAEAATLASLPAGPRAFHPERAPDAARARRNAILDHLADLGWVTEANARAARAPASGAGP